MARPRRLAPDPLRSARTSLGLSQAAAAGEMGVTQATISNWERGRTAPSDEQARRLRTLLGGDAGAPPATGGTSYGDWLSATRVEHGMSRAELAASGSTDPVPGSAPFETLKVGDYDERERRVRLRASTTKTRQALWVDLPETLSDASEVSMGPREDRNARNQSSEWPRRAQHETC